MTLLYMCLTLGFVSNCVLTTRLLSVVRQAIKHYKYGGLPGIYTYQDIFSAKLCSYQESSWSIEIFSDHWTMPVRWMIVSSCHVAWSSPVGHHVWVRSGYTATENISIHHVLYQDDDIFE